MFSVLRFNCFKFLIFLEAKEPEPDQEPRGTGVNTNVYYVTTDLTTGWTELDDLKPRHLKIARKIKIIFTGDLKKPIVSNPWFNGKESDYLRCQISRITHSTSIIPNTTLWKLTEDKLEKEKNDEGKLPSINESLLLNNWVHFEKGILNEGRIMHKEPDPESIPENSDAEQEKIKIIKKDPFDEVLKSVLNDKPIKSPIPNMVIPAWKLSYVYDDKIYTNPHIIRDPTDEESMKKDITVNSTIVSVRSLIWPGAYAIRLNKEIYNLYFGWGYKFSDDNLEEKFVFQSFPKIIEDIPDQPEPQSPPAEMEGNMENMGGDM